MKMQWNKIKNNLFVLLVALCVLSCGVASWVYAKYVVDSSNDANMDIIAEGNLHITVTDSDIGAYTVTNASDSNIPAYVRFAVVVNWVDSDGNVWPYASQEGTHYTVTADGCSKVNGYYYYNGMLYPKETITVAVSQTGTLSGYTLCVQLLAEGIQVVPDTATKYAWGMTYVNGSWIAAANN